MLAYKIVGYGGFVVENDILTQISEKIMLYLPKLPVALIVLGIGNYLIRLLKRFAGRIMRRFQLEAGIIGFVQAFLTFACWVFLISIVFAVLGLPHISVAFSGSIALILVGIASNANSMIQDILAGIFLIADPDFKVGAHVKVNNIDGTVVNLDIKKTKIKDANGQVHVVSNKTFDASVYTICPDEGSDSNI